MRNQRGGVRTGVLAVIIAVLVLALAAGALFFFSWLEKKNDPVPEGAGLAPSRTEPADGAEEEPEVPVLFYDGKQYVYNDRLSALLFLGIDDPELNESKLTRNTSQADFLLLAVFDPDKENCRLIQLDRDTMCEVPMLDFFGNSIGYEYEQLALAHTYGNGLERSCENTVNAVSRLLYGVVIDNYFALTMDAIPILNDLVGGVTVTVEDDFTGVDDTLVKGETVTLSAENVEHFVRARMAMKEDPTNRARMRRQRTYMTALFSALSSAMREDAAFALDAYSAMSGSMVTDCSVDSLNGYMLRFSDYQLSGIVTPKGEAVRGEKYMEFHIDEADLQKLVIETFYREQVQDGEGDGE